VITNLVESGVGVGLIRDEIAQQSVRARRAVIWPGASMRTRLWLVHAKDRSADPLLGAVLQVVEEIWRPVAVVRDADTVAG
jgi:DNA-binding transcriptional LysR family regulator